MVAARNGQGIEPTLPRAAFAFIAQQRMTVLTTIDMVQRPWVSLVSGRRSFIQAVDPETLILDFNRAWLHSGDPLWGNLERNQHFGMLLIEYATRGRLRLNGIASLGRASLRLRVQEAR